MSPFSHFMPAKTSVRDILLPFAVIAVCCCILLTAALLYHSKQEIKLDIQLVKTAQKSHLLSGKNVIRRELSRLYSDLDLIAHIPGLQSCINNPGHLHGRENVTHMFTSFLRYKPHYFQLRFLNKNGREIIRVEQRHEQIVVVKNKNMQDKSTRYYMQDMSRMPKGSVYISPLDLNVEHGKISQPHQPALRVGKAVFDDFGEKKGFVIINYLGRNLLDLYQAIVSEQEKHNPFPVKNTPLIVDKDGQFLLADPPGDAWGLFLPHGRIFSKIYPDIWEQMQNTEQGQWSGPWGLLTLQRINLLEKGQVSSDPSTNTLLHGNTYHWHLLSLIKPKEMAALNSLSQHFPWLIFFMALPAIIAFSWFVATLLVTNRRNLHRLEARQRHFHLLYEQAPLPYQSLDTNGRLVEVNQAWCSILGYRKEEVLKRDLTDFLSPEGQINFKSSFADFKKKGTVHDCRLMMRKRDDTYVLASFYGEICQENPELPKQAQCIFIDITELQEKKNKIDHLNLTLKTIINIHRAIARQKNLQALLDECCEILTESRGYQSAWIILLDEENSPTNKASSGLKHNFVELFQQIEKGEMPHCIQQVQQKNKAVGITIPEEFCKHCPMTNGYPSAGIMCAPLKYDTKTTGYVTVSLQVQLVRDKDELQRFTELAEDIAFALFSMEQKQQRQRAEQDLQQAIQTLHESQEIARIGNYERNLQTGEDFWSDSAYRLFGYKPGEIACNHANFHSHVVSEDQDRLLSELELSKNESTPLSTTFRILRKDGNIRVISWVSRCLFDTAGEPLLHQGLFQDITEQKNMEAQLLQTEKLATIAGLAAGVSHELNSPLSAILQSIQIIEMALAPESQENQDRATAFGLDLQKMHDYFKSRQIDFFFQGIRDSAGRASSIIRDLLNFSRPNQENMENMNINALIDSSIELTCADYNLKKHSNISDVTFTKEYEPHLPQVTCVAMEIEQVLLNIFRNAIQAMAETDRQSRLTLRTKEQANGIRIEVEDTGPGMDEQTQRQVFDPFFTTKEVGKGTGLGLTISYGIIHEKHHGDIFITSRPGQGTTFCIDLPLLQPDINKQPDEI